MWRPEVSVHGLLTLSHSFKVSVVTRVHIAPETCSCSRACRHHEHDRASGVRLGVGQALGGRPEAVQRRADRGRDAHHGRHVDPQLLSALRLRCHLRRLRRYVVSCGGTTDECFFRISSPFRDKVNLLKLLGLVTLESLPSWEEPQNQIGEFCPTFDGPFQKKNTKVSVRKIETLHQKDNF